MKTLKMNLKYIKFSTNPKILSPEMNAISDYNNMHTHFKCLSRSEDGITKPQFNLQNYFGVSF